MTSQRSSSLLRGTEAEAELQLAEEEMDKQVEKQAHICLSDMWLLQWGQGMGGRQKEMPRGHKVFIAFLGELCNHIYTMGGWS